MGFIRLNRYGDPSGGEFDPAAVIENARASFGSVTVVPGDQLALSAERAAASGAADHMVRTLQRNQKEFGPAFAFDIDGDSQIIHGRARRYDVTFLFTDPLAKVWRQRLLAFLHGLGPGRIEEAEDHAAKPA